MKLRVLMCTLMCFLVTSVVADPTGFLIPLQEVGQVKPPTPRPKAPAPTPVFYIDGHTLYASAHTVGAVITVEGDGGMSFTTVVEAEGAIELPEALAGECTLIVELGENLYAATFTLD